MAASRKRSNRGIALVALVALAGCGSRTGLRLRDAARDGDADAARAEDDVVVARPDVASPFDAPVAPDAPFDAPVAIDAPDDAPDAPDVRDVVEPPPDVLACTPSPIPLRVRPPEVMLLIDHSGSMSWNLEGQLTPPSRWTLLRTALAAVLPPVEAQLDLGAVFFPGPPMGVCGAPPTVSVAPTRFASAAVLRAYDTFMPLGSTPTFDALRVVGDFLRARAGRSHSSTIVLATDGAPNCNASLDGRTCVCTTMVPASDAGPRPCPATSCLDEARTVALLEVLAAENIPTYVIGIDDLSRPDLNATLDAMAVAGGRPNTAPGGSRYYNVRRPGDLERAFTSIGRTITQCTLLAPGAPGEPDRVALSLEGAPLPRDTTRTNGWDWTSVRDGEITVFGPSCDRVVASGALPTARFECRDGG